jgi:hypothetical protein
MLFLDSASVSSWSNFASTRMFAGAIGHARVNCMICEGSTRHTKREPNLRHPCAGITTNPAILQRDGVECSVPSLQRFAATVSVRRHARGHP